MLKIKKVRYHLLIARYLIDYGENMSGPTAEKSCSERKKKLLCPTLG